MTPDHAHFAEWDAAFVLGALTAADRRAFEAHLEECAICRQSVADLAPTAGLLSRVRADRARAIDDALHGADDAPREGDPSGADAAASGRADLARARLLARARRSRTRVRARWLAVAAAAVIVVGAIAVPVTLNATQPRGTVHALSDLADVPLEASVRLTDVAWGTRIDLVCSYSGDVLDAPEGGWPYALTVVDGDGATSTLSTWRAAPGSTTQLSAGTDLAVADIGAVEIRSIDGADVLMRYDAD